MSVDKFKKKNIISKRKYAKKILAKAKKIKLIAMDIDGVLTNGDIIIMRSGEEIKTWNVQDRIAFYYTRLSQQNLKFAWITGRGSKQVEQQARDIKIDALFKNCMDKKAALQQLMKQFTLTSDEIAFIGDDLIDIPVLCRVGLSVCPLDAAKEVREYADVISAYPGGKGVLRETVELILKAKGVWERIVTGFAKK